MEALGPPLSSPPMFAPDCLTVDSAGEFVTQFEQLKELPYLVLRCRGNDEATQSAVRKMLKGLLYRSSGPSPASGDGPSADNSGYLFRIMFVRNSQSSCNNHSQNAADRVWVRLMLILRILGHDYAVSHCYDDAEQVHESSHHPGEQPALTEALL